MLQVNNCNGFTNVGIVIFLKSCLIAYLKTNTFSVNGDVINANKVANDQSMPTSNTALYQNLVLKKKKESGDSTFSTCKLRYLKLYVDAL